jgi:hypothetical protein
MAQSSAAGYGCGKRLPTGQTGVDNAARPRSPDLRILIQWPGVCLGRSAPRAMPHVMPHDPKEHRVRTNECQLRQTRT